MIAAALCVSGVLLLVVVLLAAQRTRRRPARPASRSPRLVATDVGESRNTVDARRRPAAPDSRRRPPTSDSLGSLSGSNAAPPRAVSRSGATPPFPRPEVQRPAVPAASLRDEWEAATLETVAAPVQAGRRGVVIALAITGVAATVSVSLLVGPRPGLFLLAGCGGALVVRRAAGRRASAKLRAERASAAPAVIDLLGACLLAGLNPYRSLLRVAERSPGALRAEFVRAAAELDMGRTPAAALRAVGERTSLDELRAAAAALEAAERWGAPPAEALAARAEALRSRARLRAEAEAGRAAVRLAFPLVFCFLPALVLLVVVPTMAGALRVLVP